MPDLSPSFLELERLAGLRSRAAARLTGAAATKGGAAGAADALAVLHALASSPQTASDALTLLHELQVHQVELELQAQELRESRIELEAALRRQVELYDFQPVGSFTIDERLLVHELNQTAATLIGMAPEEGCGQPLEAFFCAESVPQLRSALAAVDAGSAQVSCLLKLCPKDAAERPVMASIGADPAARRYLVSLTSVGANAQA